MKTSLVTCLGVVLVLSLAVSAVARAAKPAAKPAAKLAATLRECQCSAPRISPLKSYAIKLFSLFSHDMEDV